MFTTTSTVSCLKDEFQLPKDIHFLNCAYMSPMHKKIEEAGIAGIREKRNPTTVKPRDFFEPVDQVRRLFADIIHVDNPQRIAILPSVSYGMAIVAKNLFLTKGDNIVVVSEQFPSNVYPWRRATEEAQAHIKTISPPEEEENREFKWNEAILNAIDERTKMVSLGHIHWADGTLFNLQAIRKKSREVGALLVVDGTQSVGALPFNVREFQPDALVCGGYKWLLGPYSIGVGYFGEAFDHGNPIEENWKNRQDSENFAGLVDYVGQYKPLALKFDVGESSNFVHIPMLRESLGLIKRWGVDHIQQYCEALTKPALEYIQSLGYYIADSSHRASHLFGIRLPQGKEMSKVNQALEKSQVYVSVRGNAIRVSPHVYNDEKDMERLIECLANLS